MKEAKAEVRISKSFRLHPVVVNWIAERATDVQKSEGRIIEEACYNMGHDQMPTDFRPGIKMKDDKDEEDDR